ncbi:Cof-type HAD-IIB family hydrolase [Blautia sp. CLA-JM-H16]|uniref:Cof-type HAD-IIB family hydrolase n=1 Tax=Blautia aquisgranensis TaxID=3133153 RepID=A0ABV1BFH7_9FIRM
MLKLITTDVDGTLVKDGTMLINPEYMRVIRELTEMGITFVVCSGRQYDSERKLFEEVKDLVYFVSDGGTVIRKNDKILKTHTLPEETWKSMYHMVKEKMPECDCFIATPECCYAENEEGQMFRWLRDSYGYDMRKVPDLSALEGKQVLKFSVYHPERCEELCEPYFTPAWKDKVTLAAAGKEWMDSTPPGGEKSTAIEFIQKQLNILPEETCAFGDNLNDIAMLQKAGMSYAVANARGEVKAAAKKVCPSYSEDGVLQTLIQIFHKNRKQG